MKLAYVAGRYRAPTMHEVVQNIRAAESVAVALWQMGLPTICPHMNTALLDGIAPDEDWLTGDLEILRRCDCLVTVPGWEQSQGATAEVHAARAAGQSVFHWPECEEALREYAGNQDQPGRDPEKVRQV
jgi:hypothetical protein